MCVRRSRPLMNPRLQHVITELYIIYDSSGEIAPPPGFYKLPYDLNKGTSGNFVYLCYKKSRAEPPLTGAPATALPGRGGRCLCSVVG